MGAEISVALILDVEKLSAESVMPGNAAHQQSRRGAMNLGLHRR